MQYELSPHNRFFLNQAISKWDNVKPFDLYGDLKYIFNREMGSKYDRDLFEQTVTDLKAFLSAHGFAKENPARPNVFSLLPKGNSLLVKGSIEHFEGHLQLEKVRSSAPRPAGPGVNARLANYVEEENELKNEYKSKAGGSFFLRLVLVVGTLFAAWYTWHHFND